MTGQYDLVVAGGGLVGSAFAALLADRCPDLSIAVVESRPFSGHYQDSEFDPRVVALTETSRQLLVQIGVWPAIAERRVAPYTHMSVWDADGTGFIEFDSSDVGALCLGHIVENSNIVGALQQRLQQLANIDWICPAKVAQVEQQNNQISIELDNSEQLSSTLLVAADGALSSVRDLCGFQLDDTPYGHSAIVATVRCQHPHSNTARQWFASDGPLAFLPLPEKHSISFVWSQREQKADELMALSDEEFCTQLTRASSACLGTVESVSKRFCFPLHQRHTSDYVQPGIALLGDAAHTIHPLAGQGVNLGFKDVIALVDELQRASQRGLPLGDMSVLGRYQRQRKPDNLATMLAMKGFKELFASDNLEVRLLRNEGMSLVNRMGLVKKQLVRQAMGL
ncbi:UbiH/UbiF/VisC/COQ6 family ubiquinone biosynthesis hydroxylase [Porticoccus sp. W117]|uniref:UbiH/UbiF/VisC/COQ6 family ubiquinone biosynthesis hydroxylase n=1 Tax=Porticoccus sp. W117 TaxID=3054777 RepID=UPI002591809C|nr:UbiH/UbiF/VisC/COQ6 family ubiquinone biosynthesis hydroxylase [Porticoccus sp. W117]MDM3872312.1 UbiH/UbiF/VisC/COQ6 family ubiquinone biosynthesis hydroxylase [Porticoccus sp. W117]